MKLPKPFRWPEDQVLPMVTVTIIPSPQLPPSPSHASPLHPSHNRSPVMGCVTCREETEAGQETEAHLGTRPQWLAPETPWAHGLTFSFGAVVKESP